MLEANHQINFLYYNHSFQTTNFNFYLLCFEKLRTELDEPKFCETVYIIINLLSIDKNEKIGNCQRAFQGFKNLLKL